MAFVYFHGVSKEFQFTTEQRSDCDWNDEYEVSEFDKLGVYELQDGVPVKVGQRVFQEFDGEAFEIQRLRSLRNELIAETDWWANSDLTMTAEQTAYRQALRDITDTYTSLDDVVWPTKPE